jgi:hypothetical protein
MLAVRVQRSASQFHGAVAERKPIMSSDVSVDRQQQKVTEFLRLLPLTIEIAGLPEPEGGRHFNEGQMEVRVNTLKQAYKLARQLILDVAK